MKVTIKTDDGRTLTGELVEETVDKYANLREREPVFCWDGDVRPPKPCMGFFLRPENGRYLVESPRTTYFFAWDHIEPVNPLWDQPYKYMQEGWGWCGKRKDKWLGYFLHYSPNAISPYKVISPNGIIRPCKHFEPLDEVSDE